MSAQNAQIQNLPGFRDFFPQEAGERQYIFSNWRNVVKKYAFAEIDAPILESAELYRRKSGDEISQQIFSFTDAGGRQVALRPEFTPSLARMVNAKSSHYRKPLRWFQVGRFFRYEAPQKGRRREFYQLNADIIGDNSPQADAEVICLLIDTLREFGFNADDFSVHVSSRNIWQNFMAEQGLQTAEQKNKFLGIIDKMDKAKQEKIITMLAEISVNHSEVFNFIKKPQLSQEDEKTFDEIKEIADARGLGDYLQMDFGVVRGLAYYTGIIFEAKAKSKAKTEGETKLRAIAGGGRYDQLCSALATQKSENLPAVGFGMGDVVLLEMLKANSNYAEKMQKSIAELNAIDVFVIVADEEKNHIASEILQSLRDAGFSATSSLSPAKVKKQFAQASAENAKFAVVIGAEFPQVTVKNLEKREEVSIDFSDLIGYFGGIF